MDDELAQVPPGAYVGSGPVPVPASVVGAVQVSGAGPVDAVAAEAVVVPVATGAATAAPSLAVAAPIVARGVTPVAEPRFPADRTLCQPSRGG